MPKVEHIIIGAGLSGLTLAWELSKQNKSFILLEKSSRPGGVIRSERKEGYLLEHGPNTVMATPALLHLIEELNLTDQMQTSPKNLKRFIQQGDKLFAVPPGPLTVWGLLRGLLEPFQKKGYPNDETIAQFMTRRCGKQITERLVAPFISGIWAGDIYKLSIKSTFPKLVQYELEAGGLLRGWFTFRNKKNKLDKNLISFNSGLETLTERLSEKIKSSIHLNQTIHTIEAAPATDGYKWRVTTKDETWNSKFLTLCCPSSESASLLRGLAPALSNTLKNIPYNTLHVLHLGFRHVDVTHALNGFGYLTIPKENKNLLGCLWSSSLFEDRAPLEHVLLTVFSKAEKSSDLELITHVVEDLTPILGLNGKPTFTSVTSYTSAIPQYTCGHENRKEMLQRSQEILPGLSFLGNYIRGISVGDVVEQAQQLAQEFQKS